METTSEEIKNYVLKYIAVQWMEGWVLLFFLNIDFCLLFLIPFFLLL